MLELEDVLELEGALDVEDMAEFRTELETKDASELDTTLEAAVVAVVCKLEAEEVWELDDTADFMLKAEDVWELADELRTGDVEETTDGKLELVFVLVVELDTDVVMPALEPLLDTAELTDERVLDDSVLDWLLTELVETVEWALEDWVETIVLLLELLGEMVEWMLDETVILMLLELLDGIDEGLLEVATDLVLPELPDEAALE